MTEVIEFSMVFDIFCVLFEFDNMVFTHEPSDFVLLNATIVDNSIKYEISSNQYYTFGGIVVSKVTAMGIYSSKDVKGVEIGAGFGVADSFGSQNNDAFVMNDGVMSKKTNNAVVFL